jgi:hypothetical protein
MITLEGDTIFSNPNIQSTNSHLFLRPITFIIDKNTPLAIINIITAMRIKKMCTWIYSVEKKIVGK